MKRYILIACMIACCIFVVSGCKGFRINSKSNQESYVFRAVIIEVPDSMKSLIEQIAWTLSNKPSESTSELKGKENKDNDRIIEELISSKKTKVTKFPLVYINPGEEKEINKQKQIRFPDEYVKKNNKVYPTSYTSRGVGRRIFINLQDITNNLASFSYEIEDVKKPSWVSHKQEGVEGNMRQPFFPVRGVSSSSIQPIGSWLIMGGMITETKNKTNERWNTLICLQVKRNKFTQQPH